MPERPPTTPHLDWAGKARRARPDGLGGYVLAAPGDARPAAGLTEVERVGETGDQDNLLLLGDATVALDALRRAPGWSESVSGRVDAVYLDPPFNTRQAFTQYDDTLGHDVWLAMMREVLEPLRDLLSPRGSVWVHCDDREQAYLRVLMDEIFGRSSFVATIVWEKAAGRDSRTDIATNHDFILVFAADRGRFAAARGRLPFGAEQLGRYGNPDGDGRGPWHSDNMTGVAGKGRRAAQIYPITLPSGRVVSPPEGRAWVYTRERFEEQVADGRIWFGPRGDAVPRVKRFLAEVKQGLVPRSIWPHAEVGHNGTAKREMRALFAGRPFDTPKPEALLERVIHIASGPGGLVLDAFAGSGTTPAVAHKMGRRWIAVERSPEVTEGYTLPRLRRVVAGEDAGGVTAAHGWAGGGGFRVLRLTESSAGQRGWHGPPA